MTQWIHIPILAAEIAQQLLVQHNGTYIDATLGLGGHTAVFLKQLGSQAHILGFDKDEQALQLAQERIADTRLRAVHSSYTQIPAVLKQQHIDRVDGVLFDLGLSSYQLDNPARGFSILRDGPLDMRFDLDASLTAAEIVNKWGLADIERILWEYGEERHAHAIAMGIMAARRQGAITTTQQLKTIVENVVGGRGKIHPATQTFQALRIAVNDELGSVAQIPSLLEGILKAGARAAVLTFHSLEDRFIKNRFKEMAAGGKWRLVNKHVIVPSYEEVRANSRARSAKLRIIEKL